MTITHTLGVDIAKAKFDVALHRARAAPTPDKPLNKYHLKDKTAQFTNDAAGFEALLTWLHKHGAALDGIHAAMEATGAYYEELATFLCAKAIKTSVVNPALISGYAKASLSRTKTDKADAKLIAVYCDALQPALWLAPAPDVRHLRELTRRLVDLKDLHQQEQNRLSAARSTHESITVIIGALEAQIKLMSKAIAHHIDQHPDLKQQSDLLGSIPGIGALTIDTLLAAD
jgi:transposase